MAASAAHVIDVCPGCGAYLTGPKNFCTGCGMALNPMSQQSQPPTVNSSNPHHVAAHGFAQAFGLHPALAMFAIVVDAMVSATAVATLGISAPFLWFIASIFTGVVVFLGQKKWAGDDRESALIKALIVGFLVALPTPFPTWLTVPSGLVGTVQLLRNRK